MGLLASLERRELSAHVSDDGAWGSGSIWTGGDVSKAGASVSPALALNLSAVQRAVSLLAGAVAGLPLVLYRRESGGGRVRVTDHPLAKILKESFNADTTSFIAREACMAHLLLWGNAYCEIERDGADRIIGLYPINPTRVQMRKRAPNARSRRRYEYVVTQPSGGQVVLPPWSMFHVPGLGFDGIKGRPPLTMYREAVGIGLAAEALHAQFFSRGAIASGWLKYPSKLSAEAKQRIRDSIETLHSGVERAFRVGVLDEGMDWQTLTMPLKDAELLATRQFQVQEVGRIFGAPPHHLYDESRATFSNIEHQALSFLTHSVRNWLVRWEQEISRQLLTEVEQRAEFYANFNVDALLRTDVKSRSEAYSIGRRNGWLTANEIRELEDADPIPAEEGGDFLMVEANMQQLKALPSVAPALARVDAGLPTRTAEAGPVETRSEAAQRSLDARWTLSDLFRDLIAAESVRLVRREVKAIQREIKKLDGSRDAVEDFLTWLRRFFDEDLQPAVAEILGPIISTYLAAIAAEVQRETKVSADRVSSQLADFQAEYVAVLGTRYTEGHLGQIEAMVRDHDEADGTLADALEQRLQEWEERDPEKLGRRETTRGNGAVSALVYAIAGVMILRWASRGRSCPYCDRLNGRTVEIRKPFHQPGDIVNGDAGNGPMQVKTLITHPPLHDGCDCGVEPG